MAHLGNLAEPVAEDCRELFVLLRLALGVGNGESIEVVEGAEKAAELRSCLEGGRA